MKSKQIKITGAKNFLKKETSKDEKDSVYIRYFLTINWT